MTWFWRRWYCANVTPFVGSSIFVSVIFAVIIEATKMGFQFIIVLIGFAGYILPVPSLIWAWVRWLKTQPRFFDWRKISVFSGLVLASLVGFLVLVVMDKNARNSGPPDLSLVPFGFVGSILALILSLIENGPVRLPASLASFGLAALWFIGAFSA
jgi:hypothetical protein